METFIAWCAFFGGWLLFAGPIYQAALELDEQEITEDELQAVAATVPQQPRVSAWWWLIPPAGFILTRRRSSRYQREVFDALSAEQVRGFLNFMNKATAWIMVAAGALLIATKETWALAEIYEWPVWLFLVLVGVMITLGALHTAARMNRTHQMTGVSVRRDRGAA